MSSSAKSCGHILPATRFYYCATLLLLRNESRGDRLSKTPDVVHERRATNGASKQLLETNDKLYCKGRSGL